MIDKKADITYEQHTPTQDSNLDFLINTATQISKAIVVQESIL